MVNIVVFENDSERNQMCASLSHDWKNQKKIFGKETDKLLKLCYDLFQAALDFNKNEVERLKKKIFGIAKAHRLHIRWLGENTVACEPDRFIVSGRGYDRLAFIQC